MVAFAREVLGQPLDPWQEVAVIRAGELLPNGLPRFRKVLIIVARQGGKTFLLKVLALYWIFVEEFALVLGMSTNLSYAKEAWEAAYFMAQAIPELADEVVRQYKDNNDPHILFTGNRKYKIAASTRKAGRSLSIPRLIIDELREHHTWDAWNAALPTMNAQRDAQAFLISNQGDDKSVVLNSVRSSALAGTDDELLLLEWSAPEGASPLDPEALCAANPNIGRRTSLKSLLADARRALESGDMVELAGFRTEIMCQRVRALDAAIDPEKWAECALPGDLASGPRSRIACFIDVSPDTLHATLAAAALEPDGRVRVQIVQTWQGHLALRDLKRDLPGWLARVKPQSLGWMPSGPAAAAASQLRERKGRASWPPKGVTVSEIREEVTAVCMGFAADVRAGQVLHSDEPILNAHALGAAKYHVADVWRFERKGEGHCDALYAAAGAAHLARTLPSAVGRPRLITTTPRRS